MSTTLYRYPYDGFEPVSCRECCQVEDCPTCLELDHENCEDDCRVCCEMAMRREVAGYADAQAAYYAPGGIFDNLFAGGLE